MAGCRPASDALDAKGSLAEQLEAQAALVEANRATRDLAKARFETGVDTYFGVLDFQRSLFAAQLDLVGVQLAQLNNQVMLFKAVAGGGQQAASRAAS